MEMGTYKVRIAETHSIEFEVEAADESEAREIAGTCWRSEGAGSAACGSTRAEIIVEEGDRANRAGCQPQAYRQLFVVEHSEDAGKEPGAREFEDFAEALEYYRGLGVGYGEWKCMQVEYVDDDGNYHPELNFGVLYESYKED